MNGIVLLLGATALFALAYVLFFAAARLWPGAAAQIGADYYAKDAKQSADIARQVLG